MARGPFVCLMGAIYGAFFGFRPLFRVFFGPDLKKGIYT